jgi:hypothetical protein
MVRLPHEENYMSAPIYADPLMDGAADPTVIHREGTNEWWMFYTARRTTHPAPDFAWLHGCAIGIAVSSDNGVNWSYRGTVAGLDAPGDTGLNTHWAPEVIWAEGCCAASATSQASDLMRHSDSGGSDWAGAPMKLMRPLTSSFDKLRMRSEGRPRISGAAPFQVSAAALMVSLSNHKGGPHGL